MYLHHLITYSCIKCMQMLSGLFAIQTNSLISFHKQSSLLLHQGTTFNKLLALVYHRKDVLAKFHMQTYPPVHPPGGQEQYYVTSSCHAQECSGPADVPPSSCIWLLRAVLHQVIYNTVDTTYHLLNIKEFMYIYMCCCYYC